MAQANDATLVCPKCGASVVRGAKFCTKCGAQVQQLAVNLSLNERLEQLLDHVNEMMASVKSYSFQEVEYCMLSFLKASEFCPPVSEVRARDWPNASMREKQVEFAQYLDNFSDLAFMMNYELQKITKAGQLSWIELRAQYNDLCGQLKSQSKFLLVDDSIDFDELFQMPLDEACQDAEAAAQQIMQRAFENIEADSDSDIEFLEEFFAALGNSSSNQIKFLINLKDSLTSVKELLSYSNSDAN